MWLLIGVLILCRVMSLRGAEIAMFDVASEGGLDLSLDKVEKVKVLNNATICLKVALNDAMAHCLFDVGGIQMFYAHPIDPGYGIPRIKGDQDRTFILHPLKNSMSKHGFKCVSR